MTLAIGKTRLTSNFKKNFKLEGGKPNEYRLLPPLGAMAAKGQFDIGVAVHWGYTTSGGQYRPFKCVEEVDFVNKKPVIKVACPRCVKDDEYKKMYDAKNAKLAAEGKTDEERRLKLKPLFDHMKKFNRSFKFYSNAINGAGDIGLLGIAARHRKLLWKTMKELEAKGIDATGVDSGIFFNFTYEGRDTHKVDIVMVDNGQGGYNFKKYPLTQSIIDRLEVEAHDLTNLFTTITIDQVKALTDAERSKELPALVDSIFGSGQQSKSSSSDNDEFDPDLAGFEGSDVPGPTSSQLPPQATPTVSTGSLASGTPSSPAPIVGTATPAAVPNSIKDIPDDKFDEMFGN